MQESYGIPMPDIALNQADLAKLMNKMPGGFFIYHGSGDEEIFFANETLLRIFGCDNMDEFMELTGGSFKGMVHPDDLNRVEKSIAEQIAQSQFDLDYVEYRIIRKDGKTRWIEDYGHFVNNGITGGLFYVFAGDATEKKQEQQQERQKKEEQLRDYSKQLKVINQEHLRRLETIEGLSFDYESIFYANLSTDTIKAYQTSNRIHSFDTGHTLRRFTGFASEYIATWVHPEDRLLLTDTLQTSSIRKRLYKRKMFHINYRIMCNGYMEYLQLRIVNVGRGNEVSQIVIGVRSVDEEIRHELRRKEILEGALNQARAAVVAKNTFLSNMSHDIRTPMNAIVGYTALAKRRIDQTEKLMNYLDMIEASSTQLLQLINDVLEIAQIEATKVNMEEGVCNLIEIAQQVQESLMPLVTQKSMDFKLELSRLCHAEVYSDQKKLYQLILRLASNAVKYTEPGGWVTVCIGEMDNVSTGYSMYQVIVEDNGIGMSRDFMEYMFEPFERQKNTTLSGVHGTGLGLTIVKSIVDLLSGKIEVESMMGKGSKFTVTLPLRIKEKNNLPVSQSRKQTGQPKLLIVEDNELNLEIEQELLQDAGFLVDTANNGSIAVERIRYADPGEYALVLMDIQMPIMDGYQAAREIRKLEDPELSNIPIVALSANTFDEDRRLSLESGMNAHMAKPVNFPELLELIAAILDT